MAVYILYPTKRFVANVPPVNFFRAFVRLSFVRRSFATIFPLARFFFRRRENFWKQSLGRRDRFHPKIVEIGAILAIFEPFEVLEIHMPLFGEFGRSSRDLYRNPLRNVLSPGRLSKFFEKWRVRFSGKSGCWYDDMMIWWYDNMMVWWNDDMVIWWYDDMMIWWYDDNDDMMIWWYDGMMIWWYEKVYRRHFKNLKQNINGHIEVIT